MYISSGPDLVDGKADGGGVKSQGQNSSICAAYRWPVRFVFLSLHSAHNCQHTHV